MSACNMPRVAFPHVPALRYLGDEHLAGSAFAGAHRPVHIAVPDLRGLRAHPVDSAHRLPERPAVARPHAGTEAKYSPQPWRAGAPRGNRGARSLTPHVISPR